MRGTQSIVRLLSRKNILLPTFIKSFFRTSRILDLGKAKIGTTIIVAVLAVVLVAGAGSLTPPSSPASTMRTLQELYDSIAGTFNSSGISADQNGSLIQGLKYIQANMGSLGVGSDSLDFDEFVDSMTLDSNLTVSSASFNTTWRGSFFHMQGNVGIGTTTPLAMLHVKGNIQPGIGRRREREIRSWRIGQLQ